MASNTDLNFGYNTTENFPQMAYIKNNHSFRTLLCQIPLQCVRVSYKHQPIETILDSVFLGTESTAELSECLRCDVFFKTRKHFKENVCQNKTLLT